MISKNKWKKIYRYQEKSGWCGPAVIQMALSSCGIRKSQKSIAKDVYKEWWGTGHTIMLAYLSQYFKLVNFKISASIRDIRYHLGKKHLVIVNWWDDFEAEDPDGHYCLVIDYDKKTKKLTLVDPSRKRGGIWQIELKEFKNRWYDYLDVHQRTWVDGWMLWIDPSSKITKK